MVKKLGTDGTSLIITETGNALKLALSSIHVYI